MNTLRDVRRRIKTVSNISHLTDAMQKIASFALNKSRNRLSNAKAYIETTEKVLKGLVNSEKDYSHPFFREPLRADSILLIAFSSDKGLCGSYNNNIMHAAERFIKENSGQQAKALVFGKKGANFFRKRGIEIARDWTDTPTFFDYSLPRELSETVISLYLTGRYSGVYMAYTSYISIAKNLPVIEKILPVAAGAGDKEDLNLYEPGRKQALDYILPEYIRSLVLKGMLESSASEHASRTIAMEQATKNAIDMIDSLTILGNKLRQSGITRELTDIIGGTENLS